MKLFNLVSLFSLVALLSACGGGAQTQPSEADPAVITPEQPVEPQIDKGTAPQEKGSVEVVGAIDEASLSVEALEGVNLTEAQKLQEQALQTPEADVKAFKPVVYFGYDQSGIDDENMATLVHYAQYLTEHLSEKITLTGHTDARGTPEYNLALGEKRAKSVKEGFMLYGVNESRIHIVTMGEEMPAVDEQTEAAWALNRRVEFSISQ